MTIYTRVVVYATLASTLFSLSVLGQGRSVNLPKPPTARQADSLRRVYEAEHNRRTLDPTLGRVPLERLDAIRNQVTAGSQQRQARAGVPNVTWIERGPVGFTGTLNALLADPSDATARKIWAGSQTGGLWSHTNVAQATTGWTSISDAWESKNISALATDPSNTSLVYAATGSITGESIGSGIWKSGDKGKTWLRLSATIPQSGTSLQSAFSRITALSVSKTGVLLAGTQSGVLRSADQGQTWQVSLAPQQQIGSQPITGGNDKVSTIRAASDGFIYVAMSAGRLFRSTTSAATAWTEITPPNTTPYVGIRTELAVAAAPTSGTAQTLYAAQIAPDASFGGNTLRWLMQSNNSGQTWQAMTRPVYTDAPDLDITLGLGDQYFTLAASPDTAKVVYLTAYDQLYRSGDGGTSWSIGRSIGRTTAFLPLLKQGAVWSSDNKFYFASIQQLVSQGIDPTLHDRSNRFGGLNASGMALKNVAGNMYRLTGSSAEPGLLESSDISNPTTTQAIYPAYPLRPFIDQNEPDIQVAMTTNGGFLTRNLSTSPAWDYYSANWGAGDYPDGGVDYDSRNNTLFFWSDGYMKATGIGAEPVISTLTSSTLTRPTYLKVGRSINTLFAATLNGQLYKLTDTNLAAPTVTRLDGGAFPAGTTISGIDIGATDSVLVVTLSNYGVQSVWYTTNAGADWVSKDVSTYGLPDMPVYGVLINPLNRQQVLLATELGAWSTSDITAANPGWTLTNTPAPLIRSKQLVYRPADGIVALVTSGRGIWETNAWALGPPALLAGTLSTTAVCAGSSLPLSFTLTNSATGRVVARLSDATGDFSKGSVIGEGTSSPLSVLISTTAVSGTGYRIRLEAPTLSLSAISSSTLTVSNLTTTQAYIADRRQTLSGQFSDTRYSSGYVCPGDVALLRAVLPSQPNSLTATYRWANDGQVISDQTAATLLTGQTGTYSFTASVGSCTTTSANGFLLISVDTPTLNVVNPIVGVDGPICPGTAQPLGVSYLGQGATYQWMRNGTLLTGSTAPLLSVTQTGGYSYSISFGASGSSVTGAGTCIATAPATYLTFSSTILPPVVAVTGDVAPTLCGNESLELYASAQPSGTTYQWLLDGRAVSGQNVASLTVNKGGVYRVQVQRGSCSAVSDPIAVTANSQLSNGIYFYGSTTLCTGESLVLYAKNTAHSLQWTKNNVPIAGATGFNYTVSESGNYGLRYVSGTCSGTSAAVSVVFSQTLTPTLLVDEHCADVELSTRDFPLTGTVSFSWLRNGQPVSQGTQAYQTVTLSGVYSVSVTNGVCQGVSKPVSISIGQPSRPTIAAIGNLVRCPTSAITLQRVAGPYSYWRQNGVRLDGASSSQLVATETGVYSLVFEQGSCLTESASVSVVIGKPVSVSITDKPFIRAGQSAVVPVQVTGPAPWSFSVVGGPTVSSTYQSPYSLTLTPSRTTSYSLVGVTNSCGAGTGAVVRVVVDGADVSLAGWTNKRYFQAGDSITYSVRVTNAGPDVAENVTLVNRLPVGLSYVSSLSSTASQGDTLRLSIGNVPAGESRTVSVKTRINKQGTYLNAVEVVACNTPDPDSRPNTGTGDGEDDAIMLDNRTSDSTRYVAISPNPNGRILPAVASNQPAPVPNQADLSLSLTLNKRTAQLRDTIQVTMQVYNQGGASTSLVQTGLTLPNGTYSVDKIIWNPVSPLLTIDLGQVGVNQTVKRTVYWVPTASDSCRAEIIRSSVADPDSTPNNRATRPGEDDEAVVDIRVLR
ncbi:DUF11 domain-containing protein [Fibrivirga algicola]|uniref:DUF11 domain-containing protein n=1 Tax=Fibrivirga algicola TaxID=2950420 RepID=A0ABX0QHC6_9BACT|nr:DUF11 domain-containing protein [Fibrivirga algicola]NID11629.1 DUF11 domain-containing protein [Fibrivirga algicola]